jgi:hypothetical protein
VKEIGAHIVGAQWNLRIRANYTVYHCGVVITPPTSRTILGKRNRLDSGKASQMVEQSTIKLEILRCG